MKRRILLISTNVLSIVLFSLSILFTKNYFLIGITLLILLGTGMYTSRRIQRLGLLKSEEKFTAQRYSLLIIWNLISLGLLMISIFLYSEIAVLLIFSIIFFASSLGALLGHIKKMGFKQKNEL
jgi:hypothetical protein